MSDNELSDIEPQSDNEEEIEFNNKPTFSKFNKTKLGVDDDDDENEDGDENDDDDVENVDDDEVETIEYGDENDDDDDDDENSYSNYEEENDENVNKSLKEKSKKKPASKHVEEMPEMKIEIPMVFEKTDSDFESDSDEEEDEDYLQKFDKEIRENYIVEQHPESKIHNYDEIYNLAKVQRNKENIIIDDLHKTIPILTKYEKTKILGLRAKQINNGAKPFIQLKNPVIDGYLIALKELEEKKIPVIIRRPLPNGGSEYWKLKDLEII